MINFDIKVGFKEILAVAVGVPLCYEKLRKLKLKYDIKERKENPLSNHDGIIFSDVIIDQEGRKWRREK